VVDIICFRKLGHNEQDTPALTQPLMYKKIAQHPGTRKLYADKLAAQGFDADLGDEMVKATRAALDAGKNTFDPVLTNFKSKYAVDWMPYLNKKWTDAGDTAIPLAEWSRLAERITTIPDTVTPHQLVKKVYADRAAMGRGELPVDWGMGEHMAFASLVASGYPVRLSGEDCGRGTFTHRHAVIHDQNREKYDEGTYTPLQNVAEGQAPFVVIDSILSEEAVLAFEYGYASNDPNTLVIWEAQFGDFVNGAQVVIDQFIASGEVKWGRVNGITLMLPHGYEGQGPEHSSARLERFMQLSADTNMQVVQPTTASQIFHVLRRQMVRNLRKPLIIMTPKSLLRAKDAASPLSEFTEGGFPDRHSGEGRDQGRKRSSGSSRAAARSITTWCASARTAKSKTWPSCGSSSCTRSRTRCFRPSCASIRTPPRSSGARTSRRTRAPGSSCSTTSTKTWWRASGWGIPVAHRRHRRRWVIRPCIKNSKKRWSTVHLPSSRVLSSRNDDTAPAFEHSPYAVERDFMAIVEVKVPAVVGVGRRSDADAVEEEGGRHRHRR
jgi:hypothetical protein